MKLSEIAEHLSGTLEGNGEIEITAVAGLKEAGAGDLSFLANPKYASHVAETGASAVIVPNDWDRAVKCSLIRVENSDHSFAQAAELFYEPVPASALGIHPTAFVAESARIGEGASIGAHCTVEGGVVIGANTVIF